MSRKICIIVVLLLIQCVVFSQESNKIRVPSIDFYISLGLSPSLAFKENQHFKGEYYFYPQKNSFPLISWEEFDSTRNLQKDYSSVGISGTFGVRAWKNLYTGIYYQLVNINGYSKPGVTGSLFLQPGSTLFFMVGMQAGYIFHPISKHPQWEILPMASFGSYFGNEYYSNTGKKWQMNIQVRNQYHLKGRWGLFFAPAYSLWVYKQKGSSEYFSKATLDESMFNRFSLDIGLSVKLQIARSLK